MKGRNYVSFLFYFILVVLTFACDKSEKATKRLMRAGNWKVTELIEGDNSFDKLPSWEIGTCANHEDHCYGTWKHDNGSKVTFFWRFTNIGGTFDFHIDPLENAISSQAYSQCVNFSGYYKVIKGNSRKYHFESKETFGYSGKLVTLKIEKL